MQKFQFQKEYTFEQRLATATEILAKYNDKIPIIIQLSSHAKTTLHKYKFLVPKHHNLSHFVSDLRKYMSIKSDQGIYLILETGISPCMTDVVEILYDKYKNIDGFLYITYYEESIFG